MSQFWVKMKSDPIFSNFIQYVIGQQSISKITGYPLGRIYSATTKKLFTHFRSTSWESAISCQKIPQIILGTDGIFRKPRHAINVKSDWQDNIFVKNSTLISITYVCSTWGGIAATESLSSLALLVLESSSERKRQ